jgi:hypothetical protein
MNLEILHRLKELGAEELSHVNGSLLAHLQGTHDLLLKWGNREALCNAGLYHAVYGTVGFQQNLIRLQDRDAVAALIGEESESIVYLFSACDREYVYAQLLTREDVEYRDRFQEGTCSLAAETFADLCELTMANELEIARWRPIAFLRQHCDYLRTVLTGMCRHVSAYAVQDFRRIFGETP